MSTLTDALAALDAIRDALPATAPPLGLTVTELRAIDALRRAEYKRLDDAGQTYLDYTGGGLYGASQLRDYTGLLATGVFGNPHSINPTSRAMTELVEAARDRVLAFFHGSADDYDVVFTPNATGALRLVGESFPFAPGSAYLLTADNHNSVNGIREFTRRRGAAVNYVPLQAADLRLDETALDRLLTGQAGTAPRLFAFPAQSNFSGVQHDLAWIERAHASGWRVLLDAAAFAPTNRIDLARVRPDFLSLSFYKMFGFPTGAGALIVRRDALAMLERPWFAGGTISLVSVQGAGWHQLLDDHAAFEDGTVNYLSLPGITIGLDYLDGIGIETIHRRVAGFTSWLLTELATLFHRNGSPLVKLFGPSDIEERGGTIAFTFLAPDGAPYDFRAIESLAGERAISLRTGCFCNPGAGETAHNLTVDHMRRFFEGGTRYSFDDFYRASVAAGRTPATIRVSVGIATTAADIGRFGRFAAAFVDRDPAAVTAAAAHLEFDDPVRDSA